MRACVRTARFCPDPGQGLSNNAKFMKTIRVWLLAWLALTCLDPVLAQDRAPASRDDLERHFELVTVGALAFTNVWVHRQTNYNILIRHQGGIHTLKLTDLPSGELAELRSQIGDLAMVEPPGEKSAADGLLAKIQAVSQQTSPQNRVIIGAAAILLIALIFVVRRRSRTAPPA